MAAKAGIFTKNIEQHMMNVGHVLADECFLFLENVLLEAERGSGGGDKNMEAELGQGI